MTAPADAKDRPHHRWCKAAADLRAYAGQIALIAVVLVLGAAGMVAALDARAVLQAAISASFESAAAPDVVLWFDPVDEALLAGAAQQAGVAAVAARRVTFTRIAAADGRELPMQLTVVRDPLASAVGRLHRHAGDGNATADAGLWIEQSGRSLMGPQRSPQRDALRDAQPRTSLRVRTPGGGSVDVPLAGYLHDTSVAPSTQEQTIYAWATPAVAAKLQQNTKPDQLLIKLAQRGDWGDVIEAGNQIAAWAKQGVEGVPRAPLRIQAQPAAHPHAALMNTLLRVLGVLSAIAFISAAAWGAYMVALWMKREQRVIGILKTLGASSGQIALQYLLLAGPWVLVSAALALPLGAVLGQGLIAHHAESLNIDVSTQAVPTALRWLECALALGLPLVAVAWPMLRAARMTPRQAIDGAGISAPAPAGRWRALLLRLPGHHGWRLALRNSFRRPARLALIVLALASGGALLLTTHSNYDSLMQVIDRSLAQQGHDVEVLLQRPAPGAELEAIARSVPGVQIAEAWRRSGVAIVGPDDAQGAAQGSAHAGANVALVAYPPGSQLHQLAVTAGRAPSERANDEVLLSRNLLAAYANIRLGERLTLRRAGRDSVVRVVGLVDEIGQATIYLPLAGFDAIAGMAEASGAATGTAPGGAAGSAPAGAPARHSGTLRIKATSAAQASLEPLARTLDQALLDAGHTPSQVITRERVRAALDEHFKVVGDFIRMVALAAALVGALWLAASSGLNVLERRREIGVLRALGATPRRIAAIFLAEGAAVALLAALIATLLSLVLTVLLNRAAETGLLHVAVPLKFSWHGLAILGGGAGVLVLAIAASLAWVMRDSAHGSLAQE